jgi:DNA-binding CsgD family transcriptional regulator/tetratricopeptide (TPR) repeat protein
MDTNVMNDDLALSRREREIAKVYAGGATYLQIANELSLAPSTVRTHLTTIYRKLGVSSKIQLLHALAEAGPGDPPPTTRAAAPVRAPPSQAEPSAGKRQVTLLTAVLGGLTVSAFEDNPEAVGHAVASLRRLVSLAAERHGARVDRAAGAEINVSFGVYHSRETDAERAVHCAVEIRDLASAEISAHVAKAIVSIGVFTGSVVFGGLSGDFEDAMAGTGHRAGALARGCNRGNILVCRRTRFILGSLFKFGERRAIEIDGSSGAIDAFPVIEVGKVASRFEALHGLRLTTFVGRNHELGLLRGLYEAASRGNGQVVILTGEAGIGKSRMARRLIEELVARADSPLVFQCSPHDRMSSLHPIVAFFQSLIELDASNGASRIEVLTSLFGEALDDLEQDRAVLASWWSGGNTASTTSMMAPATLRARTLELLDRFIACRAARRPQILLFEDLQWADSTTAAWFEHIADLAECLPILAIATARPEFSFPAAGRSNVTLLALTPLEHHYLRRIIDDQAGDVPLSEDTTGRILERSEGIPLYAEECTRSIVDLEGTGGAIPPSLKAMLSERLDRLGPARAVAQAAAVIGRDFTRDDLEAIASLDARTFGRAIDSLIASRLVLLHASGPRETLQFKHALIRDAAYDTLLRGSRQSLHLRFAELMSLRKEGWAVRPELIAHHFHEGNARDRAAPLWLDAAEGALVKGAMIEAARFVQLGLADAASIADAGARDAIVCDLRRAQYLAEYGHGNVSDLLNLVEDAEACAERIGDSDRLLRMLTGKAFLLVSTGRVSCGLEVGQRCIALCREAQDSAEVFVGSNLVLGRAYYAAGRYHEAVAQFEIIRHYLGEDVTRGELQSPLNQTIGVRGWLVLARAELGEFGSAEAEFRTASRLLSVSASPMNNGLWLDLAYARMRYLQEEQESVVACLEPRHIFCRTDFPVLFPRVAMSLGPSLVATGEIDRGLRMLEDAIVAKTRGFRFNRSLLLCEYAHALLIAGATTESAEMADLAIASAAATGENGCLGWAHLRAGQAAAARTRHGTASKHFSVATAIAQEWRMRSLLERCNKSGSTRMA